MPYCGDGIVSEGEECDGTAGVGSYQQCSTTCQLVQLPYCGDGAINQISEMCDDGNSTNGDGCSDICAIEITPLATTNDAPEIYYLKNTGYWIFWAGKDPDGDAIVYRFRINGGEWSASTQGRGLYTKNLPLGSGTKNLFEIKAIDSNGAESPIASITFKK